MKILVVSYDFRPKLGGVATCAYEFASALSKLEGLEVVVLAKTQEGDKEFDQNSPVKTIRLPFSDRALLSVPRLMWSIGKVVREENIDHVINMLWMPSGLATYFGLLFGVISKVSFDVFAHGVEVLESRHSWRKRIRALLSPLKKRVFKKSRKVLCVSNFTANLLERDSGISREKLLVVNNGVNPDEFQKRAKSDKLINRHGLQGKKVCLTITRLEDYKGVDQMMAAMALMKRPDIVYLVGGVGPDKERLENLCKDYGLQDTVQFCGKIPGEELVDYYNTADCNILLSRYDSITPNFEGFGLVFLEAAACGIPSLAGDSGGIPDAVLNEKTGLLVNPESPQEIAKSLERILFDEHFYQDLVKNCLHQARVVMTWENMAKKVKGSW